MTFFPDLRRLGVRVLAPVALTAALLAACGGGTSQVEPFKPARVIALGDENSVIVDDGSGDSVAGDGVKYTINDRRGTGVGRCAAAPIFAQALASLYGFSYAQCNPAAAVPRAFVHARVGATIDDPLIGLAAQIAGVASLGETDMVSLMIGSNDVIALFEQVRDGAIGVDAAVAEARLRGKRVAALVSGMLDKRARVIVITNPDLGLSPYAAAQVAAYPGARALLTQLGFELNGNLRTSVEPNDGRYWGLVLADDIVAAMHRVPTAFLLSPHNVTHAACTTASAKDCVIITDTDKTLVTEAGINNFLWASDRHVGPDAHARIGQQVQSRAINNPF